MRLILQKIKAHYSILFYGISFLLVCLFLWTSSILVSEFATEERKRVEIWAEAIRIFTSPQEMDSQTLSLVSKVLEENTTIPMILCDQSDSILLYNNIEVSGKDSIGYLRKELTDMKKKQQTIPIIIDNSTRQYLYYNDSLLLRKLVYFPYIQLLIIVIFVLLSFWGIKGTRRAEQNSLWVGLSKETAHQLGTPISSLLAWVELLRLKKIDAPMLDEIEKDALRLQTIANRFSKIGSQPTIREEELGVTVIKAVDYMRRRISPKIEVRMDYSSEPLFCNLSAPLIEWVIENLTKNAIDAINGVGTIEYKLYKDSKNAVIEVSDTGKGMTPKQIKGVFKAGYTTKSRGWGLGLTLAKRIIEEYHNGKIYILRSEVGIGTAFRVEIPLIKEDPNLCI